METVISKDGTKIAYEKTGSGPALILIGGAFQDHNGLAAHAAMLSKDFTVYNYDRRGRGASGDTQPYAVEREIEDIDALIQSAGGKAFVFGGSSGAALALDAAAHGLNIPKLAVHEPPFVVDDSRPPVPADFLPTLKAMLKEGRRGDAAQFYLTKGADMPVEAVTEMRNAPYWAPGVEAVAHTLAYDAMIMDGTMVGKPLSKERWTRVTMPTLITNSANSFPWVSAAVAALARLLPDATQMTFEGEAHDVSAEALVPALVKFFTVEK